MRIIWQTVRRITNEILGAKVLKFFLKKASYTPSADMKSSITSSAKLVSAIKKDHQIWEVVTHCSPF